MKRNNVYLPLFFAIFLLISACSFDFSTTIDSDGSGEFGFAMGLTGEDLELMGEFSGEDLLDQAGGDSDALCGEMTADLGTVPEGSRVEYEEKDGGFVCTFIAPFNDLDELREIYAEMDVDINTLEFVDGDLQYDVEMNAAEGGSEMEEFVQMSWTLTVPGTVGDNNATTVDGRTLTWEMELDGVQRFEAQSSKAGSLSFLADSSSLVWFLGFGLLCLCGLVLVGGGVGFYFYNKKKKETINT